MIVSSAPAIDPRTAADVERQLQQLLKVYAPAWNEIDPVTGAPKNVSAALIGVSAQFAEVLIQRLNEVPQKNFLRSSSCSAPRCCLRNPPGCR